MSTAPSWATDLQKASEGNTTNRKAEQHLPGQPAKYASLLIDIGANILQDASDQKKFPLYSWNDRFLHASWMFYTPLGRSPFSFGIGGGIAHDRYDFQKAEGSTDDSQDFHVLQSGKHDGPTFTTTSTVLGAGCQPKQPFLTAQYLEGKMEFRINNNIYYPKESFFANLGGHAGLYLMDVSQHIPYTQQGKSKERIDREDFGLSPVRYGIHGRIGWQRASVFGAVTLSPLFEEKKGTEVATPNPTMYKIGVSIDLF